MATFQPIKSSNLIEASHDGADKCQVRFKNGLYEYEGVSAKLYSEFAATFQTEDSSGKFFNAHIRNLKSRKIG